MPRGLTITAVSSLREGSVSVGWGPRAESLLLLTNRGVSVVNTKTHDWYVQVVLQPNKLKRRLHTKAEMSVFIHLHALENCENVDVLQPVNQPLFLISVYRMYLQEELTTKHELNSSFSRWKITWPTKIWSTTNSKTLFRVFTTATFFQLCSFSFQFPLLKAEAPGSLSIQNDIVWLLPNRQLMDQEVWRKE